MAEATRKYANLKSELHEAQETDFYKSRNSIKNKLLKKRSVPARKMQELKLAFSEFYLSLILLQNYQNLNFTGFRKILKKHDKVREFFLFKLNFNNIFNYASDLIIFNINKPKFLHIPIQSTTSIIESRSYTFITKFLNKNNKY